MRKAVEAESAVGLACVKPGEETEGGVSLVVEFAEDHRMGERARLSRCAAAVIAKGEVDLLPNGGQQVVEKLYFRGAGRVCDFGFPNGLDGHAKPVRQPGSGGMVKEGR